MPDVPRPFLKWLGGKTHLLEHLIPLFPKEFGCYHETFLGGGSLFFALERAGVFAKQWDEVNPIACLWDCNWDLVKTWWMVERAWKRLAAELDELATEQEEAHFYRARAAYPEEDDPVKKAALFIYLNKLGYNGLWRTGPDLMNPLKSVPNFPWGKRTGVQLYDPENLKAVHGALKRAYINQGSFEESSRYVYEGDVVYMDPPYVDGKGFTGYNPEGFDYQDQELLSRTFQALVENGATVILSGPDTPWMRSTYSSFELHRIEAPRSVRGGRDSARELIVVGRPE